MARPLTIPLLLGLAIRGGNFFAAPLRHECAIDIHIDLYIELVIESVIGVYSELFFFRLGEGRGEGISKTNMGL